MDQRTGLAASGGRLAIVVADGDVPDRAAIDAAWPGWADGATLVVAADGGARGAERLGFAIDLIVGDDDSLGAEDLDRFAAAGVEVRTAPVAKDESDTELAILAAVELGATGVVIVGALGGARFDHALANVALLAHPALAERSPAIVDPRARIVLLRGPASRELEGRPGDLVSLLPLGDDVMGVTTSGLRYPLSDEPLRLGPARGISNIRLGRRATVAIRAGRLLIVEAPATLTR
ncbi:MAG: thiamine diphosphokinase [Chloroflexi bacterium]|nr:thiamine diphosphokinase [Chloroflexota bacterium]